jgi:hypothetical protein
METFDSLILEEQEYRSKRTKDKNNFFITIKYIKKILFV